MSVSVSTLDLKRYPDLSGSQSILRTTIGQLSPGGKGALTCRKVRLPEVGVPCGDGFPAGYSNPASLLENYYSWALICSTKGKSPSRTISFFFSGPSYNFFCYILLKGNPYRSVESPPVPVIFSAQPCSGPQPPKGTSQQGFSVQFPKWHPSQVLLFCTIEPKSLKKNDLGRRRFCQGGNEQFPQLNRQKGLYKAS